MICFVFCFMNLSGSTRHFLTIYAVFVSMFVLLFSWTVRFRRCRIVSCPLLRIPGSRADVHLEGKRLLQRRRARRYFPAYCTTLDRSTRLHACSPGPSCCNSGRRCTITHSCTLRSVCFCPLICVPVRHVFRSTAEFRTHGVTRTECTFCTLFQFTSVTQVIVSQGYARRRFRSFVHCCAAGGRHIRQLGVHHVPVNSVGHELHGRASEMNTTLRWSVSALAGQPWSLSPAGQARGCQTRCVASAVKESVNWWLPANADISAFFGVGQA